MVGVRPPALARHIRMSVSELCSRINVSKTLTNISGSVHSDRNLPGSRTVDLYRIC